MKVSTRGRYGLRLLLDLAQNCEASHVKLASIAERLGISVRYLEQVAIILRREGVIRSVKGAQGGYLLAKKPELIILGDVLRGLEGDMLITDPPLVDEKETRLQKCIRENVFAKINEKIAQTFDRETLADISNAVSGEYSYFI